jgi:RNA polymerase sigma-70 factor (ECF subfamily)
MLDFQELYQSFATEVYRFAFWLTGDSGETEDITSETFIRAWVNKSAIRTETLKAYLFVIARNIYLGQQRKRNRQVVLEDIYHDPSPGPEQRLETQFELLGIQRMLQALPEIDRTAFILRVQHELPYAEVARILELPLSVVKVKVHRVRKKLLAMRMNKEAA